MCTRIISVGLFNLGICHHPPRMTGSNHPQILMHLSCTNRVPVFSASQDSFLNRALCTISSLHTWLVKALDRKFLFTRTARATLQSCLVKCIQMPPQICGRVLPSFLRHLWTKAMRRHHRHLAIRLIRPFVLFKNMKVKTIAQIFL